MADFVDRRPDGAVYTASGSSRAIVGVVRPAAGPAYVRTYSDGRWTNNLLSLPHF